MIVNPNLPDSGFASGALAGVGVAFYVAAALRRLLEQRGLLPAAALAVAELLDLVALGTVADVVPFDVNNRILVAQGLQAHPRRALRARHHRAAGAGAAHAARA